MKGIKFECPPDPSNTNAIEFLEWHECQTTKLQNQLVDGAMDCLCDEQVFELLECTGKLKQSIGFIAMAAGQTVDQIHKMEGALLKRLGGYYENKAK
ncbi:MAG: hypothetical protein AAFX06_31060 [Planctomycetota bacterium]